MPLTSDRIVTRLRRESEINGRIIAEATTSTDSHQEWLCAAQDNLVG